MDFYSFTLNEGTIFKFVHPAVTTVCGLWSKMIAASQLQIRRAFIHSLVFIKCFVLPSSPGDLPLTENYVVTENMLKGRAISKHDLGHFFVKCLSTSEWDGKTVGVCGEYK